MTENLDIFSKQMFFYTDVEKYEFTKISAYVWCLNPHCHNMVSMARVNDCLPFSLSLPVSLPFKEVKLKKQKITTISERGRIL